MGLLTNRTNKEIAAQTNQTNLQIAQETNAANQAINQANIDYAREAWRNEVAYNWEMAEYNSAANQRSRLESAGLNPYLMMNGGDAGTGASSAPSHNQPQQIPMQAARVEPYYEPASNLAQDVQALASSIGAFADNRVKMAQAENINISNQFMRQRQAAELAQILSNTKGIDARTRGQVLENVFNQQSLDARLQEAFQRPEFINKQIQEMQSRIDLNNINRKLQEKRLPLISEQLYAELQYTLTKTEREKSGRYLDFAKAKEAISHALLADKQRNNMPNITPEQADKLAEAFVTQSVSAATISEWNSYDALQNMSSYSDAELNTSDWLKNFYHSMRYHSDQIGSSLGNIFKFLR